METSLLPELLRRYGHALTQLRWFWAPAIVVVILVLPPVRALLSRRPRLARGLLVAGAVAAALPWAWSLRWLCDDAFISFRYADNLARGHGLVFNPGERVEGYTNPLWTIMIALAIKLKADPGQVSIFLTLASFAGVILLLARIGALVAPEPTDGPRARAVIVPLGSLLAAASYTLASFGTSGLETMFAAFLILVAIERAESHHPVQAGLAGVGALLSHPDHGIFYVALAGALALDRRRWRELAFYALPFVLVFVPFFLWRWRYYGSLVPNTFYAKSGDQTYFSQGGIYLLVSFVTAGLWAVLPLAGVGAFRHRRSLTARYVLIGVPTYLIYVAKIGGDFMQGRLMTPALALVFLLADVGLRSLLAEGRWRLGLALVLPAALATLPANVIAPGEKKWHLADERSFYPLGSFSPIRVDSIYTAQADGLIDTFVNRGAAPKIAIGCVGIVGYKTRLPIFDMLGLTSESVARMQVPWRGRPGHEKMGTVGHVFAAGVEVSEIPIYPGPYDALSAIKVGTFDYHLVRWVPSVVAALPPTAGLADFPGHLDRRTPVLGREGPDRLECDLWHMREYYFSRNEDRPRAFRVLSAAVAANGLLRGLEPLLLDVRDPAELGYQRVRTVSFDRHEPWQASGSAFARWPAAEATPGQGKVHGNRGPFINTFVPGETDVARGRLTLPTFAITGDVLTLSIGGGLDPDRLHVVLLIDGHVVRSATGCGSEILGRRAWNVRDFKGMPAQIQIVDESTGGWGHIVVDEVVEWRGGPATAPVSP